MRHFTSAANYVHRRYIFIAQNLQKVCPLSFYKGNCGISVIFGYRIAGCIVRTSNVSIISVTCNITVMALKTILSNVNVTDKSQFCSTLYSTYKITNIYQQIKDLHMECPSTSTELSVCAVYRWVSCLVDRVVCGLNCHVHDIGLQYTMPHTALCVYA